MFSDFDRQMMRLAIEQAQSSAEQGEIAVGAVITRSNQVICRAGNTRENLNDPTGHAEINALRSAAHLLSSWRLTDCTLYVTLEPCCMCAGAIMQARIKRLVFGAYDTQAGCCGSLYRITEDPAFTHFCIAEGGLLTNECSLVLKNSLTRAK